MRIGGRPACTPLERGLMDGVSNARESAFVLPVERGLKEVASDDLQLVYVLPA